MKYIVDPLQSVSQKVFEHRYRDHAGKDRRQKQQYPECFGKRIFLIDVIGVYNVEREIYRQIEQEQNDGVSPRIIHERFRFQHFEKRRKIVESQPIVIAGARIVFLKRKENAVDVYADVKHAENREGNKEYRGDKKFFIDARFPQRCRFFTSRRGMQLMVQRTADIVYPPLYPIAPGRVFRISLFFTH